MSSLPKQIRFIDEFRDPQAVRSLCEHVRAAADGLTRRVRLMEVCGGHTMAIHRFGIPSLLPEQIELLSGPGCPVCVTPSTYVDRALETAADSDVVLCTFGDLYRVPGAKRALEDGAAEGLAVRVVYSARDALKLAAENPQKQVVFLAVGFETTAPTVAATVMEAKSKGVANFRVMSGHKTMPGALRALVEAPEVALDGFILPGHVSTIIGPQPYGFLARDFGMACCITGFEPTDILMSILDLVRQVASEAPGVSNQYRRAVRPEGNPSAVRLMERVFAPCDAQWRGLGLIRQSGLTLRQEWEDFGIEPPDARLPSAHHQSCRCDEILRGLLRPNECALFGAGCTTESPVGPCMVSSEGACAALYKYGGVQVFRNER